MSLSAALALREGDRERLGDLARSSAVPSELAKRARIVLLAAEGMPNAQIARQVGVSRPTVIGWRDRYGQSGIQGLEDVPRSGRPREIDELDVVVATLMRGGRPPAEMGLSQWSVRSLAAELGISFASVARIWRKWGIQPHQIGAFAFSTEPELEFKISDVVGLYLDSPSEVLVVSAGQPGGTAPTSIAGLIAALQNAIDRPRLRADMLARERPDMLEFLKKAAASRPWAPLRVIIGDSAAGPPSALQAWLRENPLITMHAVTNGCTWPDLAGIILGVTTAEDQRRCRPSVKDLIATIRRFSNGYGDQCQPFTWIND